MIPLLFMGILTGLVTGLPHIKDLVMIMVAVLTGIIDHLHIIRRHDMQIAHMAHMGKVRARLEVRFRKTFADHTREPGAPEEVLPISHRRRVQIFKIGPTIVTLSTHHVEALDHQM